jgi:four helix bundle protein
MKKFDLEQRLVDFAVMIVQIVESMPSTKASNHLGNQLLRSGTSPALNYGEALGGESRNDFLHKIKIVLKELKETYNCLRIIDKTKLYANESQLKAAVMENNELISIIVKSVLTVRKNGQ